MKENIFVKNANVNNLKDLTVKIPRDKMVVLTGLSGSGKSSLAFDTIYAEGQRRYVESLSAYARQFLGQMDKPDVESIDGLSPAISIDQKTTSKNPRSTVGTVTEIHDYLRLLYARVGTPHCPVCGREISSMSVDQIVDIIMEFPERTKLIIFAPVVRGRKGEHEKIIERIRREGFTRVRVDGETYRISEDDIKLEKNFKHTIEIVVDRIVVKEGQEGRIAEAVELAMIHGDGLVVAQFMTGTEKGEKTFSTKFACPDHGTAIEELEPRMFSFNSPFGACPECKGLGHREKPKEREYHGRWAKYEKHELEEKPCPACDGKRLRPEVLAVTIGGKNIAEFSDMPISEARSFLRNMSFNEKDEIIARQITREIDERLTFLINTGLSYLTLSRSAATLSGGESQRIRLATQIGSRLMGVLYILDEPSIGLHQRDNDRLLATLRELTDIGNTLLIVEHDEDTIRAADHIIDIGPGAGIHGGQLIAQGTVEDIIAQPESITGKYLSGKEKIAVPLSRRAGNGKKITVKGADQNNLKKIDAEFPLGKFICVTGVSGSGKSSLVNEVLLKGMSSRLNGKEAPDNCKSIKGLDYIDKVIAIDQSPIGRTPRSNPATYTGVFNHIRDLFAELPESKMRGFEKGRFSFNVKGGRCEACHGDGIIKIEMHFLSDVYVPCEVCRGKRYNRETLEVRYKGKNIYDVLEMTVTEAAQFFENIPSIKRKLDTLEEVGLGYIKLGQPSTELSGGEAQRVKLATELSKRSTGKTLYVLDEPTTGLHFDDVKKLIAVLQKLADGGNTLVVIEHNLDVIKSADWLIDLGPEGGTGGGTVITTGTPEEVAECDKSYTGQYLKPVLDKE